MFKTLPILFSFALLACNTPADKQDNETVKQGNTYTTISQDTAKLGKLINLREYKPWRVKFEYILNDNSGKGERVTVPGPSDSYLQAVLYYDTATITKLRKAYFMMDYKSRIYDKSEFDFNWLDTSIKQELHNSDTNYHGHPDYFFAADKIWLLGDKLLLVKIVN